MNLYVLLLRLLHIAPGVFWAGAAVFVTAFLSPATRRAGPAGGQVMGQLMNETPWSRVIMGSAILTALSGILLYLRDVEAYGSGWITTGPGLGFLIGGVAGLAGLAVGGGLVGPLSAKVTDLGGQIAAAGGPPSPEQQQQMAALQARLGSASSINAILLTLSVLLMGLAPYLTF